MAKQFDVFGLGNALVDLEYRVDDGFLRDNGVAKGHMTLVEDDRLADLLSALTNLAPEKQASGGSAANTIYAVQGFGGRGYYACRVAGDATGAFFLRDLAAAGVEAAPHDPELAGQSGRCLVLITDDAERSMNTFLGVSSDLDQSVVSESALAASSCVYIEGYLSSSETSTQVARRCFDMAKSSGVATSLSLSDPSMVEFFREPLSQILGDGVTTLFCNEEEALTWANTDRVDLAVNELKDACEHLFVTLGERGSLYARGRERAQAGCERIKAIDTTGAGDIYAGACLWAMGAGMSGGEAIRFGNHAAGALVQRFGARLMNVSEYATVKGSFQP